MKIGIYYDNLLTMGGAEKVIMQLAEGLNADIITSGYNRELFSSFKNSNRVRDIGNLLVKINKPLGVLFESPFRFFFAKNIYKYDIYIYAGFSSLFASNSKGRNIWYCFTPNRLFYHQQSISSKGNGLTTKSILKLYSRFFKKWSEIIVQTNIQSIITQSQTTLERIKKIFNKENTIIPSPIDTSKYRFEKQGDFFLAVSRLFPEKRVSLIVEAFKKMPNKKLIVVGDGPEYDKLIQLAEGCENIQILGSVPESKLIDLYANCLATIYVPIDEDFGLVPLEGMASGKMCIGANEGGIKEIIEPDANGYLIDPTVEALVSAIEKFDIDHGLNQVKYCIEYAKKYDLKSYLFNWNKALL